MPQHGRRTSPKPGEIELRAARMQDVDALERLEAASFKTDRLSRRSFRRLLGSRSADIVVAIRDGRLAGYAIVLMRRGARSARLYSIAVAAEESGRGIGSALLLAAEERARGRQADRLRLEVREDNGAAIGLYVARGYREIGRRPDYYADGMPARLFTRTLRAAQPPARGRLRRVA